MLYLYRRVAFGEIKSEDVAEMRDLSGRELWLLLPIAAAVMWMGVYPESFMAPMRKDVGVLLARLDRTKPVGDSRPTAGRGVRLAAATEGRP